MQAAPMARLQQGKQAAVTTGKARTTGIPCAMVLRLIRALPGVPGLIASIVSRAAKLDLSVGRSGPHDFAVREGILVRAHCALNTSASIASRCLTSVTIAIRPSGGSGMRLDKHMFPKNGRDIFFAGRLDIVF